MSAVQQALQVMSIGLPVMFGVILIFILLAKVLVMLFPEKQ
ncbi:MAG: hypothetical protein ACOX2X_00770 [Peptococcia bacterium]|jgi:hypothetical protein